MSEARCHHGAQDPPVDLPFTLSSVWRAWRSVLLSLCSKRRSAALRRAMGERSVEKQPCGAGSYAHVTQEVSNKCTRNNVEREVVLLVPSLAERRSTPGRHASPKTRQQQIPGSDGVVLLWQCLTRCSCWRLCHSVRDNPTGAPFPIVPGPPASDSAFVSFVSNE